MFGNQLNQLAHNEQYRGSTMGRQADPYRQSMSQALNCLTFLSTAHADGSSSLFMCKKVSLGFGLLCFCFSLPGHISLSLSLSLFQRCPPPPFPLSSCDRMISPTLNADLFCNKKGCIQGRLSDVAGVIVPNKSSGDTNL